MSPASQMQWQYSGLGFSLFWLLCASVAATPLQPASVWWQAWPVWAVVTFLFGLAMYFLGRHHGARTTQQDTPPEALSEIPPVDEPSPPVAPVIEPVSSQAESEPEPEDTFEQTKEAIKSGFVEEVNTQLALNYRNSDYSVGMLSEIFGLSDRQIQRKLREHFEMSFPELVKRFRLEQAQGLLAEGQKVSEVYRAVGFSSHAYFSSCFKAQYGKSPREYQKTN